MARTQDLVNTVTTTDAPSTLQKKYEYSTGLVIYAGSAPRGASTSDLVWTIQKFTYDGSNQVTDIQIAFDSWVNRASADYA